MRQSCSIVCFFCLLLLALQVHSQTVIFNDPGTSYTNTDQVTVNNYGPVNVSNCSSISMSVNYNFSLPFPGGGNMESSDECPFSGGCAGDPNNADAGGCANCWDFIYVQFQLDGVTVHTELVGIPGNTNQSGTLTYGPICTNNATTAGLIVWTQTWASNESITFSNITITCWDASAVVSANPDPVCASSPFNLNATLTNAGSVNTTVWSGPGTIANPNNLNTQVSNAPAGTNTYTLTITDDNNCTNTESVSVTVNPSPTLDDPPNLSVCAGDPVDVTFTSSSSPSISWTNNNVAIGLGPNGTGDISFTAANVANTTTGTITATPNENGCTGPSQSFTVTVNPLPSVNQPNSVSVCAGAPVTVPLTGSPGATFSWTNDNTAIGLGASGNGSINFTSANVSAAETGNITVTPTLNGCPGNPVTFTITINPAPSVDDPPNQTVCAGEPVDVIFTSTGNPTYQWTNSNPAIGLAASGTGDISFTSANVANTTTGTISVTPNEGGCPGPSQTFTITVNPIPNVTPPADLSVCAGAPVAVPFTGTPGAAFSWTNDNTSIGLGASGNGNINFTSANVASAQTGNITVTPTLNGCPGNPQTFSITVNPTPTVNDPADQTVCAGNNVAVSFTGTGNPTYQWTNSNPAIGLVASGTGDISFTSANVANTTTGTITVTPNGGACPGPSQTFTITVNPIPNVNPPSDLSVCAGAPVTVPFTGTTGATFSWTNDNTAIGLGASGNGNINFTSANVASVQTGNITVTPTLNGCPGNPQTFSITVNPAPTVNDPADQTVCAGAGVAVPFTGTSGATYQWTNSNPAIGLPASGTGDISFTSANVAATTTGTITVTPSAAGCTGPAQTFSITVNPIPSANPPGDQTVCAGAPVAVPFTGTPGATFSWTNDNTAIGLGASGSGNINFTAANVATPQTGHISVTPSLGTCIGTAVNVNITVNPAPSANDPADQTVCAGNNVAVSFTGTGSPTYQWTNSNPAIGLPASGTGDISFTSANVAATTTGIITVTPSAAGCTGPTQTFNITVNPIPSANPPGDQTVCAGAPVSVSFTGTAGATFSWTNDNTTIGLGASGSGNINFTAANVATPQTGHISVTPSLGTCIGTAVNVNITVNPLPIVNDVPDATLCSGQVLSVHFTGNNNPVFNWSNSNTAIGLGASGSGDINFTATGAGTALITITPLENGCTGANQTFNITVNPIPNANLPGNQAVCAGAPVAVPFTGTPGATFSWTNGNTAIGLGASGSGNISFTAANVGTMTTGAVSVTPSLNGCTGPAQNFDITVNPLPIISNIAVVCAPDLLTYSISLTTTGLSLSSTAGTVNGSGGNYTVDGIPAGTNVTLSSTDTGTGCQSQQSVNAPNCNCAPVTAPNNPNMPSICEGAPTPTLSVNVAAGFTVDWYAAPSGGTPLLSGSTSYTPPGTFAVGVYHFYAEAREIATNCTSSTRVDVILTVNPVPQVGPQADQTVCAGAPVAVPFTGTPGATFSWTNSNTAIGLSASGNGNIAFNAINSGNTPLIANLQVTPTLNACTGAAQSFNITVNPIPALNPPGNQSACSGAPVSINFGASAGASVDWTNSDPSIGLAASGNGNISFTAANVASPTLAGIVATPSLAGCAGLSQTFNIEIKPTPDVAAPVDQSICAGNPVSVVFNGSSGAVFSWNNDNTAIGLGASGTGNIAFTGTNTGLTPITGNIVVSPSLNGCSGAGQTFHLTVNPLPTLLIDSISCAADLNTYTIHLHASADQLLTDAGSVTGSSPDFSVVGIPIASNTTLTATYSTTPCSVQQTVNAPNCSCPPVTAAGTPNDPGICEGLPLPALTVSVLPGATIDWYAGPSGGTALLSGNTSYSPAGPLAPGTYSFYAEARDLATSCISSTRTKVTLTVLPNPVLQAPGDQAACPGTSIQAPFNAGAAIVAWTNDQPGIGLASAGAGDIAFTTVNNGNNPILANIQATPSLNGCIGNPVVFHITVHPLPTLGIDSIVCSADLSQYTVYVHTNGDQLTATAGVLSGGSPQFQVADIPQGTSLVLNAANSATGCSRQINVNPPNCNCGTVALATTPGDQTICEGYPIPALTAEAESGYTIDWYSTPSGGTPLVSGADTYTPPGPFLPGIYHFYAESREIATGCVSTSRLEVTLTVLPTPALTTPADQSACEGTLLQVNFSGTAGSTFSWTNTETAIGLAASGNGNIQFLTQNPGNTPLITQVNVTAQLDGCTSTPQAFSLTVYPLPQAAISGNTQVCEGDAATLTASGATAFSWSTGASTASISIQPSASGTYTVTVTENACSATASTFVTLNLPSASTQQALTCDSAQIGTTIQVIPNAAGCDSVITTITAFDAVACVPVSALLGDSLLCFGGSDGVLTLNVSNGLAPFQYQWSNGIQSGSGLLAVSGNTVQIPNLPAGAYTVTVTGANGVTSTALASILSPPQLNAEANVQLLYGPYPLSCAGASDASISGMANGGTPPFQYAWNVPGQNNPVLNGVEAGTYLLTVTDAHQCTATGLATVIDPPTLGLEVSLQNAPCGAVSVPLQILTTNGISPLLLEIDGVQTSNFSPELGEGAHPIVLSDANGCTADTLMMIELPEIPQISLPADTTVAYGDALALEAQTNLQSWQSLVWSPMAPDTNCAHCLRQEWMPERTSQYQVVITDQKGCTAEASVRVVVSRKVRLFIPNVFSPNDDGDNDFWTIFGGPSVLKINTVHIFDRWGDEVYRLEEPVLLEDWEGWDGNFRGQPLNPAVFVYYLEVELIDGEKLLRSGDVTIVR